MPQEKERAWKVNISIKRILTAVIVILAIGLYTVPQHLKSAKADTPAGSRFVIVQGTFHETGQQVARDVPIILKIDTQTGDAWYAYQIVVPAQPQRPAYSALQWGRVLPPSN